MKHCYERRGRRFVCLSLAALLLFSAWNVPLLSSPLSRLLSGVISFSDFVRETHAAYVSDVSFKSAFVDLNGAYARLIGRRVYHGVCLLNNGMLDRDGLAPADTASLAEGILRFSRALRTRGIGFLFVLIPSKMDLENRLRPKGIENCANEGADVLCGMLAAEGTEVLDLRPLLVGSVADVERYYYRTDHHWNADGAFLAYGALLSEIARSLPSRTVDMSVTQAERWERTVYPDWMLGSHGKRVGRFFGGIDDLVLYTPGETCTTSLTIPHKGVRMEGEFSEVLLRTEYLDRPSYHERDAYCVYLGGNYPLAVHENPTAENGAHVLLVKDSFSLPTEAMLAVSLARLDAIDPRYFHEETVLSYAERTHPELVVLAINPSVFSDRSYATLAS